MNVLFFVAALDLGQGVRMELVRVEAGKYMQGSPNGEVGREADEVQREVEITHAFLIGKSPVRRIEFERFVAETGYKTEAEKGSSGGYGVENGQLVQKKEYTWRTPGFAQGEQEPVVLVTLADAQAFAGWLSKKSGRVVRLPTEAEWEYAARRHGSLVDMLGKVNQWTMDKYTTWTGDDATDPLGREGERYVLRGGSTIKDKRRARFASRIQQSGGSRNADNGFRVVVEDDVPAAEAAAAEQAAPIGDDEDHTALGLVVVGSAFAAVWFAVRFVWRKLRGEKSITVTHDGLIIGGVSRGTVVKVMYRDLEGRKIMRSVPITKNKEFLYTGFQPTGVRFVVAGDLSEDDSPGVFDDGPDVDNDDDERDNTTTTAVAASSSSWDPPRAY